MFCVLFGLNAFAQETDEPQTVGVEEIYLAKDDGEGKAGGVSENFLTTDIPIYCVVQLNSPKPTTVKMNLVAVNVKQTANKTASVLRANPTAFGLPEVTA